MVMSGKVGFCQTGAWTVTVLTGYWNYLVSTTLSCQTSRAAQVSTATSQTTNVTQVLAFITHEMPRTDVVSAKERSSVNSFFDIVL